MDRRRTSRALVVLALLLAVALLFAPPADAHSRLLSSDPADGSSLTTGPSEVRLTFNEPVTVTFVRATDTFGTAVEVGDPVVSGAQVTVGWPGGQPGGLYRVGYSVVSSDGHPVEGILIFSYSQASPVTATTTKSRDWTPVAVGAGEAVTLMVVVAAGAIVVRRRRKASTET